MTIKNAIGPKAEEETKVFSAFIRTQDWEIRSIDWEYRGERPIDFASIEEKDRLGVELCEWMDRRQAQWVNERDRYRTQIESELERRGVYQFVPGEPRSRCSIQASVIKFPSRPDKATVVNRLIDFLIEFEHANKPAIYRGTGIAEAAGPALPPDLAPFFGGITFFGWPTGAGIGVSLPKAWNRGEVSRVEKGAALLSLRRALSDKIITKARIYEREKEHLALSELLACDPL